MPFDLPPEVLVPRASLLACARTSRCPPVPRHRPGWESGPQRVGAVRPRLRQGAGLRRSRPGPERGTPEASPRPRPGWAAPPRAAPQVHAGFSLRAQPLGHASPRRRAPLGRARDGASPSRPRAPPWPPRRSSVSRLWPPAAARTAAGRAPGGGDYAPLTSRSPTSPGPGRAGATRGVVRRRELGAARGGPRGRAMPRKKPFSIKQKKKQLQDKRERKRGPSGRRGVSRRGGGAC